jgi:uncharacterized membrane protein YfcA
VVALGYILGLLIGICLGVMGAGGAVLTIPVLVYLFQIDTITATFYSLFIVGITAMIGTIGFIRNQLFDGKTVIFFGIPSVISVILTTRILVPSIPEIVVSNSSYTLTKHLLLLILFAMLMIFSAIAMIRSSRVIKKDDYSEMQKYRYGLIILQGILVGIVTGLLGAGGGFLIIPALVLLARLPMKKAVGTSLFLITLNCIIGFASKYATIEQVNWTFLLIFSGLTVAGILTGILFTKKISGEKLKKGFGYFMLVMGTFILTKELYSVKNKEQSSKKEVNKIEQTIKKD